MASTIRTLRHLARGLSFAVCLGTLLFVPIQAQAQVVVLKAGKVVFPDSGGAAVNQLVVIEAGKIKAVGGDLPVPPGAQVIDLSRYTLLPGLIDAHTHLCATVDAKWDLGDFWIMAMQRRQGYRAILCAQHAREMLEAGFTTVRDVGNAGDYLDADLEKAIRFGVVPGPTVVFAGRIIAPFGGQFWDTPADRKSLDNAEYYFADSRDELRKAIRENTYFGAKVIKIVVDAQKYIYSVDDIRFIVDEAAAAGLPVAAHVQTEAGAHNAIAAGVTSLEHAWSLSDEDLALAKKQGIVLVPTDTPEDLFAIYGMDPPTAKRVYNAHLQRLRRAVAAGVPVVFGTDIMADVRGNSRGELALQFVDPMAEAGMSPAAILKSMTSDAAALLRVSQQRGAIRPGLAADLVAVSGNPLEDIDALKQTVFVMKDGKVVRNSAHP